MAYLLVIADDLTGALDSGVALVNAGIKTQVLVRPGEDIKSATEEFDAVIVNTGTRHLPKDEAYSIVYSICQEAKSLGIPFIYKKTDSALRGNIGAELEAALFGSGRKYVLFAPAFPRIGRFTIGGVQYIGTTPVAESSFADDVLDPVQDSYVPDIIARQSTLSVARSLPQMGEMAEVFVADSSTQEELGEVAKYAIEHKGECVIAGCAGLATELAEHLPHKGQTYEEIDLEGPFLVMCGSVHPVSRGQADYAAKKGLKRIWLSPQDMVQDGYLKSPHGSKIISDICLTLESEKALIVETIFDPDKDKHDGSQEMVSAKLPQAFGKLAMRIYEKVDVGTSMVFGGDILQGFVEALGIGSIEPIREVQPGVVLARSTWQERPITFITKAGSFGTKELIWQLEEEIR